MKMRSVKCPKVKEPEAGTWTNAKVYGNQSFISGMTGRDPAGNVQGESSMCDHATASRATTQFHASRFAVL